MVTWAMPDTWCQLCISACGLQYWTVNATAALYNVPQRLFLNTWQQDPYKWPTLLYEATLSPLKSTTTWRKRRDILSVNIRSVCEHYTSGRATGMTWSLSTRSLWPAALLACPQFMGRATTLKQEMTWVFFCTRCPIPVAPLNKSELCHPLHHTVDEGKDRHPYCRESIQQWLREANSRWERTTSSGSLTGVPDPVWVGGVAGG